MVKKSAEQKQAQKLREIFSSECGVPGEFETGVLSLLKAVSNYKERCEKWRAATPEGRAVLECVSDEEFAYITRVEDSLTGLVQKFSAHPYIVSVVNATLAHFPVDVQAEIATSVVNVADPVHSSYHVFADGAINKILLVRDLPVGEGDGWAQRIMTCASQLDTVMNASKSGGPIEWRAGTELLDSVVGIWKNRAEIARIIGLDVDEPVHYIQSVRDRVAAVPDGDLRKNLEKAMDQIAKISIGQLSAPAPEIRQKPLPFDPA